MKNYRNFMVDFNFSVRIAIVLVGLFLCNCTAKLGYIDVTPRTTLVPEKVHRKLYIFIDHVKDTVIMERGAGRKLKVNHFRQSLENALKKSFEKSFDEVIFTNSTIENQLTLHIYRVEPYWKITRSQDEVVVNRDAQGREMGSSTRTHNFSRAVFQFQVTLFDKGTELSRADNFVWSREEMPTASLRKRKRLFIDGLEASVEAIHESIVITGDTWKMIKD